MSSGEGDFDRRLVSYVERHRCLYDRGDQCYADREKADAAWARVAADMESTECVVRARWRDLRKSFRKAYREWAHPAPVCTSHPESCTNHTKSCTNHTKSCIAFPFFESMLWLAPYLRKRPTCSTSMNVRKCPVHGFFGNQFKKTNYCMSKKIKRKESIDSETSLQSSSSYFTEFSYDNGGCNHHAKNRINACVSPTPELDQQNSHENSKNKGKQDVSSAADNKDQTCGKNGEIPDEDAVKSVHRDNSQEKQNGDVLSKEVCEKRDKQSLDKYNSSLSEKNKLKTSSTQTLNFPDLKESEEATFGPIASNTICQTFVNADINFMISILSDMQLIPKRKRVKFKREVMELVEKYVLSEAD